jgi:hypothetical protein
MAPKKDPKFTSPIKPPKISSMTHEENEEIQNQLSKLDSQINELNGGSLKLIRCLKGLMKIKVVFRLNNFPIIRIFQGDLTPIVELLMDGLQKE